MLNTYRTYETEMGTHHEHTCDTLSGSLKQILTLGPATEPLLIRIVTDYETGRQRRTMLVVGDTWAKAAIVRWKKRATRSEEMWCAAPWESETR